MMQLPFASLTCGLPASCRKFTTELIRKRLRGRCQRMKRFFFWLIAGASLAGLVTAFLMPELIWSAADRTGRVLVHIAPEIGARLRFGSEKPLERRLSEAGFVLGDAAFIRIFKQERAPLRSGSGAARVSSCFGLT
jgi:uncharacterized membrane protein YraQ (UPF0718 family)